MPYVPGKYLAKLLERKRRAGKIPPKITYWRKPKGWVPGYMQALEEAARIKKRGRWVVDINSLPEEYREYHARKVKRREDRAKACRIKNLDPKIYLHKYYPWSYQGDNPTLVLQGFYSIKYAKKKYLMTYGPDALKHVKFIKGRDALEREFRIGKKLHVNNCWIKPQARYIKTDEAKALNHSISYRERLVKGIKKGRSEFEEKQLAKNVESLLYGREPIRRLKVQERKRVQNLQEVVAKRKKDLYEE